MEPFFENRYARNKKCFCEIYRRLSLARPLMFIGTGICLAMGVIGIVFANFVETHITVICFALAAVAWLLVLWSYLACVNTSLQKDLEIFGEGEPLVTVRTYEESVKLTVRGKRVSMRLKQPSRR